MNNNGDVHFIDDPNFKDRRYLLNKIDTFVDPLSYRKKLFLRGFIFALIKASISKESKKVPDIEITLKPVPRIPKIDFKPIQVEMQEPIILPNKEAYETKQIRLPIPKSNQVYPVKTFPYPKPTPLYQLKPAIRRNLSKKKLPFLKPKIRDIFVEGGKLYYLAKPNDKTYLDQVKSIISDSKVSAVYCDGINKPLLVDYLSYAHILTKVSFNDKKRLNNMIKKFAEENGIRFSKDKPVVLERLKNSIIFQASLGSDFIEPRFIIKKGKIL